MFIGRTEQLARLQDWLSQVEMKDDAKPGKAVLIRGRRRVGKSRLVEEFVQRTGVPYVFYAATGRPLLEELALFADEVASSNLPGGQDFREVALNSWDAAFRLLAHALPETGPSVVVLDELPYLIAQDPGFEASLQLAFDRLLSKRRVLLIGVGSDLAMMELLNAYGRPFHQRASEMVVPALSPAEVGNMLGMEAQDAFDAYVVSGGLPLILDEWPVGASRRDYLRQALNDPTSALVVSAERALASEFPAEAQARKVLSTIGGRGERTFTAISQRAGINATAMTRSTELLAAKRLVVGARPLSTRASRETRYRVVDPYLRFWLTFVEPQLQRIERGGGGEVYVRMERSWDAWLGRVVEPVIHEAISRLNIPFGPNDESGVVGSYWTRTNNPEVDLVVADEAPVATSIYAVGSIKWRSSIAFDGRDLDALLMHRSQVPGATSETPLLVVARSGTSVGNMPHLKVIDADELIEAWQ